MPLPLNVQKLHTDWLNKHVKWIIWEYSVISGLNEMQWQKKRQKNKNKISKEIVFEKLQQKKTYICKTAELYHPVAEVKTIKNRTVGKKKTFFFLVSFLFTKKKRKEKSDSSVLVTSKKPHKKQPSHPKMFWAFARSPVSVFLGLLHVFIWRHI